MARETLARVLRAGKEKFVSSECKKVGPEKREGRLFEAWIFHRQPASCPDGGEENVASSADSQSQPSMPPNQTTQVYFRDRAAFASIDEACSSAPAGSMQAEKYRRSPTQQSRIFWSHRRAEIITGLRRQMVRSSIKTLTELGDNGKPSTAHIEGGKKQNLKTEASFLHQVF